MIEIGWVDYRKIVFANVSKGSLQVGDEVLGAKQGFYFLKSQFRMIGSDEYVHFSGAHIVSVKLAEVYPAGEIRN